MTLNVFKMRNNKPMIDSLESAREFLSQCKNPFRLYTSRGYWEFTQNRVSLMRNVDEWTDVEVYKHEGEKAVSAAYKLRKHINAYFKN